MAATDNDQTSLLYTITKRVIAFLRRVPTSLVHSLRNLGRKSFVDVV